MPPPRIPIDSLPEQTALVETDLLVVQNGSTTRKMEVGLLSGLTTASVPPGGTSGQVLGKTSSADYATAWLNQTGGGGGATTEDAVDAVAAALVAGNNIDIAYNDAANQITIDVEPLTKSDVGLGNVDNTSDVNKPVSTAQATADALKADKATTLTVSAPLTGGGDLSTNRSLGINDFTNSQRGTVPSPGGTSTGRFLKDDGTWDAALSAVSGAGETNPYTYNTATVEPPSAGQLRANAAPLTTATKLWLTELNVDGLTVTVSLGRIKTGTQIYVQSFASTSQWVLYNVTADAIDKGTYWEATVTTGASAGTVAAGRVIVQLLTPVSAGGGGGGITTEDAVDAVAAALVAGNNIDIAYNDAANTITIDVEPLTTADISGLGSLSQKSFVSTVDLQDNAVINAKLADMAPNTIKGTPVGGDPGDLTAAQVRSLLANDVGGSPTTKFIRGDGTWAVPPDSTVPAAGTVTPAMLQATDFGDWTVVGGVATIDSGVVSNAKLATAPASTFKGNATVSTAAPTDMTVATAKTLLGLPASVPAALNGLTGVWMGTQAQYDAIVTKDSTVLYAVLP